MAAWTIIYSIVDEKGANSTTEVNLPSATDYADVQIFAAEMAKLIDPLITGAITRIGVSATVALPGTLTASAAANSDVEEGARFQFKTANNYFTGLRIPTFDETLIVSASKDVDVTDGDVSAFVAAMNTGIDLVGAGGSGTIQPCDKRDDDVSALEFAREQFLNSRSRS